MFSGSDLEVIVIAAGSTEAVSRMHRVIEKTLAKSKVTLVDYVLSASQQSVPLERVCAVVLELDPGAAQHPSYCHFVRWCIQQVSQRDEFRLDITAASPTAFDENAGPREYQELLWKLKDTVQQTNGIDIPSIGKELSNHVEMIDVTRKRTAWRRFRIRAGRFLGIPATLIQIICFVVAFATALWLPVWDPGATLGPYDRFACHLTLICGIAGMPLLVLIIYSYSRYGFTLAGMFKDPRGVMYAAAGFLVGPLIIMTPVRLRVPFRWIILGSLLGCMVESLRRMAGRFRRASLPLGPENVTNIHKRLPLELRREYTIWLNPWRIPLMPVRNPRVFISYSRDSSWASDVVRLLCEKINVVHTEVFADVRITAGENWRRRLNESLADSTVVLALVDEVIVQRQWPASEIEASLRGRRLAGLPEIIAIVPAGMSKPSDESWRWLPIYRELLERGSNDKPSIAIMEYNETTAQALAFQLHGAAYRSPAMIPFPLARLIEIPWQAAKSLLFIWSAGCGVAGLVAMVLIVLAATSGLDSGRWLAQRHWCGAATLAAAAWASAACRHALGAHFELFSSRAHGVMSAHRAASIALVILIALWLKNLTLAQIGWIAFIAYSSYLALDEHWKNRGKDSEYLRKTASAGAEDSL